MPVVSEEAGCTLALPKLPLLRLDLAFAMDEPVELPPFRGNLWRGVLGPALKRIDDGLLLGVSTGALAPGTLYETFFESPPPPNAEKMRLYDRAPHPYVVDAPGAPGARRLEPLRPAQSRGRPWGTGLPGPKASYASFSPIHTGVGRLSQLSRQTRQAATSP